MECKGCASHNIKSFNGELHFPGIDGLTKPLVWVFSRLEVCLSCGSTYFTIPDEQLNLLQGGLGPDARSGDAALN